MGRHHNLYSAEDLSACVSMHVVYENNMLQQLWVKHSLQDTMHLGMMFVLSLNKVYMDSSENTTFMAFFTFLERIFSVHNHYLNQSVQYVMTAIFTL